VEASSAKCRGVKKLNGTKARYTRRLTNWSELPAISGGSFMGALLGSRPANLIQRFLSLRLIGAID